MCCYPCIPPPNPKQVSDWDKDERYMAISDLQVELKKDSKIDQVAERRICDALLDRLENDKSNNVQSIAVSWCVALPAPLEITVP